MPLKPFLDYFACSTVFYVYDLYVIVTILLFMQPFLTKKFNTRREREE